MNSVKKNYIYINIDSSIYDTYYKITKAVFAEFGDIGFDASLDIKNSHLYQLNGWYSPTSHKPYGIGNFLLYDLLCDDMFINSLSIPESVSEALLKLYNLIVEKDLHIVFYTKFDKYNDTVQSRINNIRLAMERITGKSESEIRAMWSYETKPDDRYTLIMIDDRFEELSKSNAPLLIGIAQQHNKCHETDFLKPIENQRKIITDDFSAAVDFICDYLNKT